MQANMYESTFFFFCDIVGIFEIFHPIGLIAHVAPAKPVCTLDKSWVVSSTTHESKPTLYSTPPTTPRWVMNPMW